MRGGPFCMKWFQFLMLDENVSPAADQPDSRAVGQPLDYASARPGAGQSVPSGNHSKVVLKMGAAVPRFNFEQNKQTMNMQHTTC
eukprot:1161022-Pelagomonas_calceolata.AAC.1